MSRRLKLTLLGIGFALLSWVVMLPSYWALNSLKDATAGRLMALDSSGSIWNGQATLGISDGGQMRMIPGQLQWQLHLAEPAGWLSVEVNHPILSKPLQVALDGLTPTLSAVEARVPAAWLASLGLPFNTIKPEGLLLVRGKPIVLTDPAYAINIEWQDAQSALTSIRPLGKYDISLNGYGSRDFSLDIQTKSGPLYVQAQGGLNKNGGFTFSGLAWPSEDSRAALTGILSQIGRFNDGKYQLGTFR